MQSYIAFLTWVLIDILKKLFNLPEGCLKYSFIRNQKAKKFVSFLGALYNLSNLYFDQSLEWNEEPTEEQGGAESPSGMTDDISAQNSDRKEDNVATVTEENEWDKLLRVR